MHIAIIGAGINGLCIGWELAQAGHGVTLYERDTLVAHTSSASSKLLHGGLRYLENREFRLVAEALHERQAWFHRAPALAKPLQLTLPIYTHSRRGRPLIGLGLWLYDRLARASQLPPHTWLATATAVNRLSELKPAHLRGAFQFWDGQMDDRAARSLGSRDQNRQAGAHYPRTGQPVTAVTADGRLRLASHCAEARRYDHMINAAGPWARHLLHLTSNIPSQQDLDLVRGSHLILDRPCPNRLSARSPERPPPLFVLSWRHGTLIGTTEVREDYPRVVTRPSPPTPSAGEVDYLLNAYNDYFHQPACSADIRATFAGLRPLVKSAANPSRATREYVLERQGRLTTVFGGKWTTACALARKVRRQVEQP
jgi:glycerol-3-phosphate dehydrogenase